LRDEDVVRRRRHHAERVEAEGERLDAADREGAERRFVADDSAIGGWPDDRAAGLRAEGERREAGGDGGGRAARRAARRAPEIVRVARRPRMAAGEFGGHRLADDEGAGAAHGGDAIGIGLRAIAAIDRRVALGRLVPGLDDVLDGERHPAQRQSTTLAAVELARLGENERRVEEGKGAHLALARRDRLEIGLGDGDGREPPRLDRRHDAANPERLWLDRLLHRDPSPCDPLPHYREGTAAPAMRIVRGHAEAPPLASAAATRLA
jgi:hypothetical protein